MVEPSPDLDDTLLLILLLIKGMPHEFLSMV
jgi:hypothetical protein